MNNYQGGLQLDTRDQNEISGVSKNPGVLWLSGEDRNKLAVIAITLEHVLKRQGYLVSLLDQDQINTGICAGLDHSESDRKEYIRRVAETCKILDESGLVTIVLADVHAQAEWNLASEILAYTRYSVVHVESLKLWQDETGTKHEISHPQATHDNPALKIESDDKRIEDVINLLLKHLKDRGSLADGFTPLGGVTNTRNHGVAEDDTQIAVAAG